MVRNDLGGWGVGTAWNLSGMGDPPSALGPPGLRCNETITPDV